MRRFDCLKTLAAEAGDALAVTSAGANNVEWNALRPGDGNFRVRTLGLASSIALGIALGLPNRKVICLDGDGSLLMNLCSLPTIAHKNPRNLIHVVFDNEVYEASGSGKTATGYGTDLAGMARAAGIRKSICVRTVEEFAQAAGAALKGSELTFIAAKVDSTRTEAPPYPVDEVENKYRFIRYIERTEKIEILKKNLPASYLK